MSQMQTKITNIIKTASDIDGINVSVTGSSNGTIRVTHDNHHTIGFLFTWSRDHFIGYFIDGNNEESQAVISLYSPLDAVNFVNAYVSLNLIRAKQQK